jgi:hypothetical protein
MLQEWHARRAAARKQERRPNVTSNKCQPKSRFEARRAGLNMPALKVPPSKTGTPMLETVILAGIAVL